MSDLPDWGKDQVMRAAVAIRAAREAYREADYRPMNSAVSAEAVALLAAEMLRNRNEEMAAVGMR